MFHSWVISHSYLINEPLVGFTNITRETFLWETNGQGTRNGGIIKEQLLSDLPQIGQVSGKFVKKIFISLVQCCMQRTTSRSTSGRTSVESSAIFRHLEIPSTSSVKHRLTKNRALSYQELAVAHLQSLKLLTVSIFIQCASLTVSHTDRARVRMKAGLWW